MAALPLPGGGINVMKTKSILLLNLPSAVPCFRVLHRAKVGEPNYIWPLADLVCLSGALFEAGFTLEHKDFQVDRETSLEDFLAGKRYDAIVAAYNPFDEAADLEQLAAAKKLCPDASLFLLANHRDRLEKGHIEATLKNNRFISALIYDYARNSLPEFISGGKGGQLANLFWLEGEQLRGRTEDLPQGLTLPVPRHEIFKNPAYFHYDSTGGLLTAAMGSFGCKMQCPFCWGPQLYPKVIVRSPENLAGEMAHIAASGIEEVYFHDYSFGYYKDNVLDFCRLVKERGIRLRWFCSSRFDLMSPETIDAMAEAGCKCIEFGLESGNYEVRKLYGKKFTDEQVETILRQCKKRGIHASVFIILGLPEESLEDMKRSIKFVRDAGFDYISLNILWVEPFTALAGDMKGAGNSVPSLEAMTKINFTHPSVSAEEIQALYRSALRGIYFSPAFILSRLRSIRSWKRLREICRLAWKLALSPKRAGN